MVKGERVWETGGKNTDCAAENSKETVSKKITGGAQVGWHIGQGVIRNNGKKCRKIGSKRKRKTEKRERERERSTVTALWLAASIFPSFALIAGLSQTNVCSCRAVYFCSQPPRFLWATAAYQLKSTREMQEASLGELMSHWWLSQMTPLHSWQTVGNITRVLILSSQQIHGFRTYFVYLS